MNFPIFLKRVSICINLIKAEVILDVAQKYLHTDGVVASMKI